MPDLTFAIKCPIDELETKEFPDLEALALEFIDQENASHDVIDSQTLQKITTGARYFAFSKINGDDVKVNLSEENI